MKALEISEEARAVHAASLVVDLHCDLLLTSYFLRWNWLRRHRPNPFPGAPLMGHCDIPRLRAGNVGCLALGLVISPLRRRSGPQAIRSDFDRLDGILASAGEHLVLARSAQQIRTARKQDRIAVFAGLEGAHGLDGRLDDLVDFRQRGLGYVGLVHFSPSPAGWPMVGWRAARSRGLKPYGRSLVQTLNTLGIVVDVAHLSHAGLLEVCHRSQAPVICSHTACTAVHPSPRGLDDEALVAIARTGGVVGVIFVRPFIGPGGVEAVVDHLDHIRRLVGVEHCAIGSDWEGWAWYPGALGSADRLPLLTDALLRRGWRPDEIMAAYGGNFLRVLDQTQAAATA